MNRNGNENKISYWKFPTRHASALAYNMLDDSCAAVKWQNVPMRDGFVRDGADAVRLKARDENFLEGLAVEHLEACFGRSAARHVAHLYLVLIFGRSRIQTRFDRPRKNDGGDAGSFANSVYSLRLRLRGDRRIAARDRGRRGDSLSYHWRHAPCRLMPHSRLA